MRIITGKARGLKLKTPKGMDVRPTADRVKESLFNILGNRVIDAEVLDLFAGTGNLGLEALSRGAKKTVFVDHSSTSLKLTRENALLARLAEQAEFYKFDALSALNRFAQVGRKFSIIFCDPPYNKGLVAKVLTGIAANGLIASGGVVIVEHSKHESIPEGIDSIKVIRMEKYGETILSFLASIDE